MYYKVDYEKEKVYGSMIDSKGNLRMYNYDLKFDKNGPYINHYSKRIYLTSENSNFEWEKYYGYSSNS